jgi:hypothetical protein
MVLLSPATGSLALGDRTPRRGAPFPAMVNPAETKILAMPSAPSAATSSGQSLTDTYITAPGRPAGLKGTAEVKDMIPGARYRFSVAAHTAGGYTSAYTADSDLVKPRS